MQQILKENLYKHWVYIFHSQMQAPRSCNISNCWLSFPLPYFMHYLRAVIEDTFAQLILISLSMEIVCQLQFFDLIAHEESMDWKMSCITWRIRDPRLPPPLLPFSTFVTPVLSVWSVSLIKRNWRIRFFVYLYNASVSVPKKKTD